MWPTTCGRTSLDWAAVRRCKLAHGMVAVLRYCGASGMGVVHMGGAGGPRVWSVLHTWGHRGEVYDDVGLSHVSGGEHTAGQVMCSRGMAVMQLGEELGRLTDTD